MKKHPESIDFVTVVFKRLDYAKIIHESIKKYVDYPYKYYIVNNGDNSESSVELKELKEMFDGEDNVVIVEGIHQVNQDDGVYVPAKSNQKYPQQYFIDNYGPIKSGTKLSKNNEQNPTIIVSHAFVKNCAK